MTKKFYTCRYDATFKEVFMKEENKDLLIVLLESILNIKIKDVKYLNLEKNNGNIYIRRKHFDLHVKTEKENIHIEVNNYLKEYVRPRNMAFLCNTYSKSVLRGEEYTEDTEFIQINFTYHMISENKDNKALRVYKVQDDTKCKYVNNFTIYEFNMDYYMNLWYSKKEKEIEKFRYLIMLDLGINDLNKLSKEDKVITKYMEEVVKVNEDPEFYEYMSAEEDNRKIENSLRSQYRREGLEEGRAEGRAEGERLAKLETAKNLKENGVSVEIISKSTGLSTEEVEKL